MMDYSTAIKALNSLKPKIERAIRDEVEAQKMYAEMMRVPDSVVQQVVQELGEYYSKYRTTPYYTPVTQQDILDVFKRFKHRATIKEIHDQEHTHEVKFRDMLINIQDLIKIIEVKKKDDIRKEEEKKRDLAEKQRKDEEEQKKRNQKIWVGRR